MISSLPRVFFAALVCACSSSPGASSPGAGHDSGTGGTPGSDAGSHDSGSDAPTAPPVSWTPCETNDWPSGYPIPAIPTECASIDVPRLHTAPGQGSISLRVARQLSAKNPTTRAVFVLEGGPGGSAVFTSGLIPGAMPGLIADFDLVYVDVRGTGGSDYLSCPTDPVSTTAEWEACAKANSSVPLNQYLSVPVAHDLDNVRRRLGYDGIHLFAASYGTRVAFDYLRLYGNYVVAGVFDGVAPPVTDLFADSITSIDRGVKMLIDDCEQDSSCVAVSPNLAADLTQRRKNLAANPRPVQFDGQKFFETENDFIGLLYVFMRSDYWRFRIPRAVHESVQGDHTRWNQLMTEAIGSVVSDATGTAPPAKALTPIARFLPQIGFGVAFGSRAVNGAVLCAEALPSSQGISALMALQSQQAWPRTHAINKAKSCPSWAVTPLPESERQLVSSDAKLLLISGLIDINLDPKWAKVALEKLNQAKLIEVENATHLPTYKPCVGQINTEYLRADGDINKVDMSCLDQLPKPKWD